jgi:hypothetical protein
LKNFVFFYISLNRETTSNELEIQKISYIVVKNKKEDSGERIEGERKDRREGREEKS